jgi:hypothetical protein
LNGNRGLGSALALVALLAVPGASAAVAPENTVLPPDLHSSAKGRALATKYAKELRALNAGIYHCMPWVEVHRAQDGKNYGIGFYRPPHLSSSDHRYLSVHVYIEQDYSPVFARLPFQDRASAMYSRYVVPLLRRMTRSQDIMLDTGVDGFTIILEWLKQTGVEGGRPINETIAVFVEKSAAAEFLAGRLTERALADRTRIQAWDGQTPVGQVRVTLYKDDFVETFKVKNYQLEPGVTCP